MTTSRTLAPLRLVRRRALDPDADRLVPRPVPARPAGAADQARARLSDFQIGLLLGPAFVFLRRSGCATRLARGPGEPPRDPGGGIAIWCTMTRGGRRAKSFVPLFVTRLGSRHRRGDVAPASISLISDYFARERRARAISLFMSGAFLGAGITFLFFGPLVRYIQIAAADLTAAAGTAPVLAAVLPACWRAGAGARRLSC